MPTVRQFKQDSIIYFEGDTKDHNAFLLKSGLCTRTKVSAETGSLEVSRVAVGEFFGVKSVLGKFMRDETIHVKEACVVYIFAPNEFEGVIKAHQNVLFKMLRAFSNELRSIHRALEVALKGEVSDSSFSSTENLREIGDHYYARKAHSRALYAYNKYLELESESPFKAELVEKIATIKDILRTQELKD